MDGTRSESAGNETAGRGRVYRWRSDPFLEVCDRRNGRPVDGVILRRDGVKPRPVGSEPATAQLRAVGRIRAAQARIARCLATAEHKVDQTDDIEHVGHTVAVHIAAVDVRAERILRRRRAAAEDVIDQEDHIEHVRHAVTIHVAELVLGTIALHAHRPWNTSRVTATRRNAGARRLRRAGRRALAGGPTRASRSVPAGGAIVARRLGGASCGAITGAGAVAGLETGASGRTGTCGIARASLHVMACRATLARGVPLARGSVAAGPEAFAGVEAGTRGRLGAGRSTRTGGLVTGLHVDACG